MEENQQKSITEINKLYNQLNHYITVINDSILQMNIIINQIKEIMNKNNMFSNNNQNNHNLNIINIHDNFKINSNDNIFKTNYEELRKKISFDQIKDKTQAGDFIFELGEILYKDEAGKITGMILEYDLDKLVNMINDPVMLKEQIDSGHKLIQEYL